MGLVAWRMQVTRQGGSGIPLPLPTREAVKEASAGRGRRKGYKVVSGRARRG